ncbi:hypothetical protein GCM10011577_27690 [Pseudarthrobacter polychromogenes]|uniref:Uncharacterized protein n=1 Tax=Pseudarthrobacter polychromogenes TaxID=1676 RepID=A0ABQ1XSN9_9MICC|nr:hypothetical protein GCM10011577_27690 [Pseudarthrobacter polychromogenes]
MEQNGPCMAYPLNLVNSDYEEPPTILGRLTPHLVCGTNPDRIRPVPGPGSGPSGQHIHVDVVEVAQDLVAGLGCAVLLP